MRSIFAAVAAALCLGACTSVGGTSAEPPVTATTPYIAAAVADAGRPAADLERDALRHPAEVLAFAGVRPGQRVADIGPGAGYYTRMFSKAVGPEGRVIAVLRGPPRPDAPQRPRIFEVSENPAYANVEVSTVGYAYAASEPVDVIFISQIYHDFHLPALSINVPEANRALFNSLKPGGTLVIIDHAAVAGTDLTTPDTLHRIDEAIVRRELEGAGFVFEADSQILRNPDDPRTARVFEADIRGHTDQFMLRFRKPG
jgi:predicted methyltransferase